MTCRPTTADCWRPVRPTRHDGGIVRVGVDAGDTVDGTSFLPAFCDYPPDDQRQDENRQHEARELDYPHSIHRKPPSHPTGEWRLARGHGSFDGKAKPSGKMTDPSA